MYIHVYIRNHENNVSSRLSQQWFCGNPCSHDNPCYTLLVQIKQRVLNKLKNKKRNISGNK